MKKTSKQCDSHSFLCLQHPQTLKNLKYLSIVDNENSNQSFFQDVTQSILRPSSVYFGAQTEKDNFNLNSTTYPTSSKKERIFAFDKIYTRNQKFKHVFDDDLRNIANSLLDGYSSTAFIYGTQEFSKDKVLIGQSQNPGLVLLMISALFQICRKREIQHLVTMKISGLIHQDAVFHQIFGNEQEIKGFNQQIFFQKDATVNGVFIGCPQIIIRNVKTALKIINLIWKKVTDKRAMQQQPTENLILTIKLQIEDQQRQNTLNGQKNNQSSSKAFGGNPQTQNKIDSQPSKFTISKLNIIKLADPSCRNTAKRVNKGNQWFIDLFNYLQQEAIDRTKSSAYKQQGQTQGKIQVQIQSQTSKLSFLSKQQDEGFICYLRTVAMNNIASVYTFVSVTNKMTTNECLNALILSNYLSNFDSKVRRLTIDFDQLVQKKRQYEQRIIRNIKKTIYRKDRTSDYNSSTQVISKKFFASTNSFNRTMVLNQPRENYFSSIMDQQRSQINSTSIQNLYQLIRSYSAYIDKANVFEYEFALLLTQGCDSLQKYIFKEQIQDFFYAKKIAVFKNEQILQATADLFEANSKISYYQEKLLKQLQHLKRSMQRANTTISNLKETTSSNQNFSGKCGQKNKISLLYSFYSEYFKVSRTLSTHYGYQTNDELMHMLDLAKQYFGTQKQNQAQVQDKAENYCERKSQREKTMHKKYISSVLSNKQQDQQMRWEKSKQKQRAETMIQQVRVKKQAQRSLSPQEQIEKMKATMGSNLSKTSHKISLSSFYKQKSKIDQHASKRQSKSPPFDKQGYGNYSISTYEEQLSKMFTNTNVGLKKVI